MKEGNYPGHYKYSGRLTLSVAVFRVLEVTFVTDVSSTAVIDPAAKEVLPLVAGLSFCEGVVCS
jgi:hypothetical protein